MVAAAAEKTVTGANVFHDGLAPKRRHMQAVDGIKTDWQEMEKEDEG